MTSVSSTTGGCDEQSLFHDDGHIECSPDRPLEGLPPEVAAELAELRLRVAAQDRLIAAMLDENESIHDIRRSQGDMARIYHRFCGSFLFEVALAVRARVKGTLRRLRPVGV